MLPDAVHSQGASLCAYAAQLSPRLVALASHGDRDSELPLIWRLCAAWSELGYSVAVLDATARESARNPGLQQRLRADAGSRADTAQSAEATHWPEPAPAWPIVPASRGWSLLPRASTDAAACISRLFHGVDVVLIYAPACELVRSFHGLALHPVLTSSAQGPCILNAYQAFRHLLIDGALQPTIVCTMDAATTSHAPKTLQAGTALQDCAHALLGHGARLFELPASDATGSRDALHSLALRLLETAWSAPVAASGHGGGGLRLPAMAAGAGRH